MQSPVKDLWNDPDWVEFKSRATKEQWTDKFRKKRSKETSEQWANTDIGERVSKGFTEAWQTEGSKFNSLKDGNCPHCNLEFKGTPFNEWRSHLQHCKDNPKKKEGLAKRNEVKPRTCKHCGLTENWTLAQKNGHTRKCNPNRDEDPNKILTSTCKYCKVAITGTKIERSNHSRACSRLQKKDRKCSICKEVVENVTKSELTEHAKKCKETHVRSKECRYCGEVNTGTRAELESHRSKCRSSAKDKHYNHKVKSIRIIKLDKPEPVYCLSVDDHHNYALTAGVFTHNCFKPIDPTGDMYEDSGRIYTDMKNLGDFFSVPIFTFAQTNRGAWEKPNNGELVVSEDLAHSAQKAMRCSVLCSLNFKKDSDRGFLYIGENRLGPSYKKVKVTRDLDKCQVKQDFGEDSDD